VAALYTPKSSSAGQSKKGLASLLKTKLLLFTYFFTLIAVPSILTHVAPHFLFPPRPHR